MLVSLFYRSCMLFQSAQYVTLPVHKSILQQARLAKFLKNKCKMNDRLYLFLNLILRAGTDLYHFTSERFHHVSKQITDLHHFTSERFHYVSKQTFTTFTGKPRGSLFSLLIGAMREVNPLVK